MFNPQFFSNMARLLPLVLGLVAEHVHSAIVVDGEWSPWSTVKSYCVDPNQKLNLITCGGGVETKYRYFL